MALTLYNIIHGAEFWLAFAIFNFGAACGISLMLYLEWLGDKDRR